MAHPDGIRVQGSLTVAKGYVIFTETIRDEAGMEAYVAAAMPTIMQSARILVVDDNPQVLEGEWPATRTVVLEFDSVEAAKAWYESPGYQAAIPLRQAAADTSVVIVAGL